MRHWMEMMHWNNIMDFLLYYPWPELILVSTKAMKEAGITSEQLAIAKENASVVTDSNIDINHTTIPEVSGGARGTIGSAGNTGIFEAPKITVNSKGELTNGQYTITHTDMEVHVDGKDPMKSQFMFDVDANKAVLDAAAYADANNL